MSAEYQPYFDMLAGKPAEISEGKPLPGYYEMRDGKTGPRLPVAIWLAGGELKCRVGAEMRDAHKVWTWCAKRPIPKALAKAAFETGRWSDEPEALPARSNMPADPFEAVKIEIEDRAAQAEAWLAAHPMIATQMDCDIARNMQAALLNAEKQADKDRQAEKRPHFEAGKAVDAKFKPLTAMAATWAARLRDAIGGFLRAEENRQQDEARKKFEAEKKAVEAARMEVEKARAKLEREDPIHALLNPAEAFPELPLAPAPVKVQAGGAVGRKAGLKTVYVATVTDHAAALAHYAYNAQVRDIIQKLASADVRGGARAIPGVTISEEREVA